MCGPRAAAHDHGIASVQLALGAQGCGCCSSIRIIRSGVREFATLEILNIVHDAFRPGNFMNSYHLEIRMNRVRIVEILLYLRKFEVTGLHNRAEIKLIFFRTPASCSVLLPAIAYAVKPYHS